MVRIWPYRVFGILPYLKFSISRVVRSSPLSWRRNDITAGGRRQGIFDGIIASRIPRYFGLISYSLYLWHWPILSYFTYIYGHKPLFWHAMALGLLSWLMADLSWRFVERPFRVAVVAEQKRTYTLVNGVGALLITALVGLTLHFTHGVPDRRANALPSPG
jgi:hypothetical protein